MAKLQAGEAEAESDKPEEEGKVQQQAEEPRVKQVTFLDADDGDTEKRPKKEPRKRTKRIMHELRNQMEFYFGDANLNKDRFMKQQTDSDPEGYVPISLFMSFSNIQTLTTDAEILIKALKFSNILQVSEDGSKVRRTTPVKYMTQEETDARTVYVEGFHKFITREWIRRKFSKCGKVTYISMPRFKTSQEIKGYAFVEFETPEEAVNAVKMLNSVPDEFGEKPEEKVSASVKQSKNLVYWKKRASREGIDPAEMETVLNEAAKQGGEEEDSKEGTRSKSRKKKRKNRPSLNQGEGTTTDSTVVQKTDNSGSVVMTDESKENAVKQEAFSETDDSKVKKSKKSKKKRRRKSSLQKLTSEDIASQNVGDAETAVPKSKESIKSIKTEAEATEEPKESSNTVVTSQVKECKEFSSQSRKRQRSSEAASDQSSAKIRRIDPHTDQESEKAGEKGEEKSIKYECTSLEGSQNVWEVCEVSPGGDDPGKDKDSEPQKSSSRKRKDQMAEDSASTARQCRQTDKETEGDSSSKQSDVQKSGSKKRKMDPADTSQEKALKVKKQKDSKQSRRSIDQVSEMATGERRKRKRRSVEGGDEGSRQKRRKSYAGSSSEAVSDAEEQEGKKKRHRKHRLPEPDIRLRVMTKEMWARLKKDYLEQQKVNMRKLKDQLREASLKRREQAKNKQNNGQDQSIADMAEGRPPAEFVPNVILEVKSEAELCLQTIKADIPPSVQVAYVDIRPGMTEGHIRCKDAESASKLLKTGLRGLTLSQVEGEAEMQYWNKLITDRQAKLSDTKRRKRRGKLKILQRAQNPHEESSQRQHLIFTDDGVEVNIDRCQNPDSMQDDFNAYSHRRHAPPTTEANENHDKHDRMGTIDITDY